jgi:hypothetical protein
MVIALLFLGIDAVGKCQVERRSDAVGLTHEASAAHEDQRVSGCLFATLPASADRTAGDVCDPHAIAVDERTPRKHAPHFAVEHECPRARAQAGGTVAGVAALVVLLVGQAMASMDASILVVAAPSIRSSFQASGAELQLIVATYTLTFGALVVTGARLGDVLGRRRAFVLGVGAYSMILAAGVAAGQILGGLLVTAHLVAAAWRPALLLNAPVGAPLALASRRVLPAMAPSGAQRLDLAGGGLLATAMLALIVPLTFGREYGWPVWVWPCFAGCVLAVSSLVAHETRFRRRGGDPLLDLGLLREPGLGAGVIAVLLIMSCYAGFLVSLTLRLQGGLGFHASACRCDVRDLCRRLCDRERQLDSREPGGAHAHAGPRSTLDGHCAPRQRPE